MKTTPSPPHPGKILREYLGGSSITEAAKALGIHRTTLTRVLSGNAGISPELAIRLGMALGTSPDLWAGLQLKYDLYQATRLKRPKIGHLRTAPIKDRSVRELKGMFSPPTGRKVSIAHMRIRMAPAGMAEWEAMKPIGREFGSPDYERLEELDALAARALGSMKKARRWLDTPNDAFGGDTPESAARTKTGFRRVKGILAAFGG